MVHGQLLLQGQALALSVSAKDLLPLLYLLAQQQRSQELILCALIVDGLDEVTALLEHLHLADLVQLVTLCLLGGLALLDKLVEVWLINIQVAELVLLRRATNSTDELAQLHNVKPVHLVLLLLSLDLLELLLLHFSQLFLLFSLLSPDLVVDLVLNGFKGEKLLSASVGICIVWL